MNRRTLLKSAAAMAVLGSRPVRAVTPPSDGALKITRFKIHKTTLRWRSLLFLEIETDAGITGIGEGTVWRRVDQVEAALRWLEPHLTGKDPSGIERHWDTMYYRLTRWRSGAVLQTALSAVDIALWDLEGKRLGLPVSRLMGGPLHTSLRAYHSHIGRRAKDSSPQALADAVLEAKAGGWDAVKWSVGGQGVSEASRIQQIAERTAAVRNAVGNEFEFGIELHESFTPRSALRCAKAVAP